MTDKESKYVKEMHLSPAIYEGKFDELDRKPTRDGFGTGTTELGHVNKDVVVMSGDLAGSTRASWFKKEYPDRFIQGGISEQNMVQMAVGLAAVGKIPYTATYAVFQPGRCWDQIRISCCYGKFPVKLMGAHAGVSVGPDGATHQALEDIAITRVLPNMTVLAACDAEETKKAVKAAAKIDGPVYIRFHREKLPVLTTNITPFEVGKAQTFREGSDVAIIANGALVYEAILAAEELAKEGVEAKIINLSTIKPIDEDAIVAAAKECGAIVTAEEHQVNGGVGSAVAEVLAKKYPTPVEMVAMMDRFGESGTPDDLKHAFNLDAKAVKEAVNKVIKRK